MLRSFAAMGLAVLAVDVCLAAEAGPTNKNAASAIAAGRPQHPKGGRLNPVSRNGPAGKSSTAGSENGGAGAAAVAARNAPSINAAAVTQQGANAPVAAAAKSGSIANSPAVAPQAGGPGPAGARGLAGQSSVPPQPGSGMKDSTGAPAAAAVHDAVINGTGVKHSTSALVALKGSTAGKGAAAVSGTSMRPKRH